MPEFNNSVIRTINTEKISKIRSTIVASIIKEAGNKIAAKNTSCLKAASSQKAIFMPDIEFLKAAIKRCILYFFFFLSSVSSIESIAAIAAILRISDTEAPLRTICIGFSRPTSTGPINVPPPNSCNNLELILAE